MEKFYFLKGFVISFFIIALSLFVSNCDYRFDEDLDKKVTVKVGKDLIIKEMKVHSNNYHSGFSLDNESEIVAKVQKNGLKGSTLEKSVLYSDEECTKVFKEKITEDMTLYTKFGWKVKIKYDFGDGEKTTDNKINELIVTDGKKLESAGIIEYSGNWDQFVNGGDGTFYHFSLSPLERLAINSKKKLDKKNPLVTTKGSITSAKENIITKDTSIWAKTK